jgi:hypothetical protein
MFFLAFCMGNMYVFKGQLGSFYVEYKFAKIKHIFMAKKSDPVLHPDPTWIKSSGSDRIKIHNPQVKIIFIFFQVCTHAQLSLSQFPLPAYTFYFFENQLFCRQKEDPDPSPSLLVLLVLP